MSNLSPKDLNDKIPGYVGYDSGASGIFLPGGSYCTLIAMICARHTRYPNSKKEGIREAMQVTQLIII